MTHLQGIHPTAGTGTQGRKRLPLKAVRKAPDGLAAIGMADASIYRCHDRLLPSFLPAGATFEGE
jgi:hypothetical protein